MALVPPALLERARALRRDATDAEGYLWALLRSRQIGSAKFRRQHPLGPYVLDFFCAEAQLAVELDGSQHAEPDGVERDATRDAYLARRGIRVVRFWNHGVLTRIEAVLETLWEAVCGDQTMPSP